MSMKDYNAKLTELGMAHLNEEEWKPGEQAELRRVLAQIFPTEVQIRMVFQRAGVNAARVDFAGGAEGMWFCGIGEALKANNLNNLVLTACGLCPRVV